MKSESANQSSLPEHVIFSHVLPFLPFKTLTKLRVVNKSWNKLISQDRYFALDQSHHTSHISNGILFASSSRDKKLIFLSTNNSPVGVPDPSLSFLSSEEEEQTKILASTNGILCMQRVSKNGRRCIYVCNPATRESHFISNYTLYAYIYNYTLYASSSLGLAFDIKTSPQCYKLVSPIRNYIEDRVMYSFNVFSSNTGQWAISKQRIVTECWSDIKSVYCNRVLYWDCKKKLLAFDPWNDIADCIMLPDYDPDYVYFRQDIGVYKNRLTCIRIDMKCMNVWVLKNKEWESKYNVVLDDMIEANEEVFRDYCYMVKRRTINISDALTVTYNIFPLPYEGGERLFFALTISGKEKLIYSYDTKSGEVEMFSMARSIIGVDKMMDEWVFSYHNSMAKLPRLST